MSKRFALVLAALTPATALAQQAPPPEENDSSLLTPTGELAGDNARQATFDMIVADRTADGPGYGNHAPAVQPEFALVATDDKKQASVSLSFDLSNPFGGNGLSHTALTLTGTTDLAKNGATSFGDFASGLTGGTSIELGFTHYSGRFAPQDLDYAPVQKAVDNCRAEHTGAADLATLCDPSKYKTGASMFVHEYNRAGLRRFLNSGLPGGIEFFGIKGRATQTDFTYLDQAAFATKDVSRFGFTLTALYGELFASGRTSLATSFTYGRSDKADDEIMLCQAVNATQTRCITAAGGPPKRKTRSVLSVELRQAFGPSGKSTRFGLAPLLSLDFENKDFAADLPIYLVGDGVGKLRGGIRITYENTRRASGGREEDVKFGAFVGVPFSLFFN
ncbi:hypothetical protein [Sphingomonas sp. KR3-1]|uniref:hypothetical protein n=1 Tax=Sphingomonas sp. KR3-1 TaxID=3156611 RepID=UPI0032B62A2D